MTTYLSITSTGGRIGRIQWANTVPFSRGTIWGQVQWDTIWPKTVFSERMRRLVEGVREAGEQMAQAMQPVVRATAVIADEFGRAFAAAGGVIESGPSPQYWRELFDAARRSRGS
jgi:hypothetical protein